MPPKWSVKPSLPKKKKNWNENELEFPKRNASIEMEMEGTGISKCIVGQMGMQARETVPVLEF